MLTSSVDEPRSRSPVTSPQPRKMLSPRRDSPSPRRRRSPTPERRERRRSPTPERRDRSRSRSRRRSRSPPRRRYSRSPPRRRYDPREPAKPSNVLGVFGLSHFTTSGKLEEIFGEHPGLEKVALICDKMTGESRGFAFITYKDDSFATTALEATKNISIDGRTARVDYSVTLKPHDPTPGQYMGPRHMMRDRRGHSPRRNRSRSRDRYRNRSPRDRSPRDRSPRRNRSRSRDRRY